MKKTTYNKLVRDKIPNIIIGKGLSFKAKVVKGTAYERALANKLKEEAEEVFGAWEWLEHVCNIEAGHGDAEYEKLVEEMADLFEVYVNALKTFNISTKQVFEAVMKKRKERGAFEDGIFLEWVEEDKN